MDTSRLSVSRAEFAAYVGRPTSPLVLDVRRPAKFHDSNTLLAAARHCPVEGLQRLVDAGPPQDVVVYCVYGHDVSQGAARQLREAGWNARFLEGGMEGGEPGIDNPEDLTRWRAQPLLTLRKRADLGVTGERASRWVTRARPKIDRVACPWLIRRFIDPSAEFHYVATDQVFAEASRLDAVPFDIADAPITHHGDGCSFDALLDAFHLKSPALDRLAAIVRAADTDRCHSVPQASGLLAVSLGLSRLHADDHGMLAAAMPVYDALYAWATDAQNESHTWQSSQETA